MRRIKVVAHAGSMGTPDDSLESVQKGIELQADIVEIDIRFDDAGIPVLSHDKLKAGNKYETVYDALALLNNAEGIQLNADMKEKDSLEGLMALKEIFEKFDFRERMYFSGIDKCNGNLLQKIFPGYEFFTNWNFNIFKLNNENYIRSIVHEAKSKNYSGLNLNYRFVTKKTADICRENDMKLYTWTVNKEADMTKLADWGVDAITTRNPPLLKEILGRKN